MYFAESHRKSALYERRNYSAAEESGFRHLPPPLKSGLGAFAELPGFKELTEIKGMPSLKEFKLTGRSTAIPLATRVHGIYLCYDRFGFLRDEFKTEVFLSLIPAV